MTDLNSAALAAIFDDVIRPRYDARIVAPSAQSTFVLVGGQPGAGKTESLAAAQLRVPAALSVNGDALRLYHPEYAEVMATDPLRMPAVTQQAANAWVHMSLDYLRERRASVLMETTLRDPAAVHRTLSEFRDAGYEVQLQLIAVPETVSRLGTLERYLGQVERDGSGRWAPSAVHDAAYERAPESVTNLLRDGLVDRVIVQQRGDVTLLDAVVTPGDPHVLGNVLDALGDGRAVSRMTPGQASEWLRGVERAGVAIGQYPGAVNADILSVVDRFRQDAFGVARAAFPYDARRRQEAVERLDRVLTVAGLGTDAVPEKSRVVLDSLTPN